ncbi:MAG TPA: 1-acyl-sn-glycerol-3-phosphate acyltransferase [Spirochaetota bacterium]|nr:1-acyl-sn-glycerol-3-phosphate acyltransferase [Spirochaetota bacterium]HNT11712.1 1-acyl-sn-glycerol-3-phosphate acyltransferase [Spirochaetota bacterium]
MTTEHGTDAPLFAGVVHKQLNPVVEFLARIFFRNFDIDPNSLTTLKEYSEKGSVVFASFHGSNISLLILHHVLRRTGVSPPDYAMEYNPFLLQTLGYVFSRLGHFLNGLFSRRDAAVTTEFDYVEGLVRSGKSILVSLMSRRFFLRRYLEIRHDSIIALVEMQRRTQRPIFLIPEMIFWNMNPEKSRSILSSSALGDRRFLQALFAVVKSVTPSFVRLSTPINLQEEIASSPSADSAHIAIRIRNKLLEQLHYEKRTALGPVLRSSQEMMERILYHKNVLGVIGEVSRSQRISSRRLKKRAYRYYREIAADFSILYIKLFEKALDWMFRKIFDGISYDPDSLQLIRDAAKRGPLIITPCHKSHMDYLLISYIFFKNKIIPPHIAAGVNLSFFPMGHIFRRSGAFFLRRSFKGQELYTAVFKQYIKTMVAEGYTIEFFIEGGRTRTGKLALPKLGFLHFLIEAVQEGYNKDMVFVPISINYDRILEETSYLEELRGKEKVAESTSSFLEGRKLLRRKYGRVYVSFNAPFTYREVMERLPEQADAPSEIGTMIIDKINEVTTVTPFALATTAILLLSVKGFSRAMLAEKIALMHDYLHKRGVTLSASLSDAANLDEIIEYVLVSYLEDKIIEKLSFDEIAGEAGAEDFYILREENRSRIAFYKNSIIHYFIPLSYCALALLADARRGGVTTTTTLAQEYASIRELMRREFVHSSAEGADAPEREERAALQYLIGAGMVVADGETVRIGDQAADTLKFYAKILREYLESYYIVLGAVLDYRRGKVNRKDFTVQVRRKGIQLYHIGIVGLAEALSLPNYNNAISVCIDNRILSEEVTGKKTSTITLLDPGRAQGMMDRIKTYLEVVVG